MNDSFNQNALQHYGVKGMKWGVRKDDDPTLITRKNVKPEDYSILSYLSPDSLSRTHEAIKAHADTKYTIARNNIESLGNTFDFTFGPNTGKYVYDYGYNYRNEIYQACYDSAIKEDVTDENRALLLAAYDILKQEGIADYFNLAIGKNDKTGQKIVIMLYTEDLSEAFSVGEAKALLRTKGIKVGNQSARSRDRTPQGEPVKVSVNKEKSYRPVGDSNADVPSLKDVSNNKAEVEALVKKFKNAVVR